MTSTVLLAVAFLVLAGLFGVLDVPRILGAVHRFSRSGTTLTVTALAVVLGRDRPGGLAVAGQRSHPLRQVIDSVHGIDPGEPEECVDLAKLVNREHPSHLAREVGIQRSP